MYESIRTLPPGARVVDTRLTDEQSAGGADYEDGDEYNDGGRECL